MLMSTFTYQKEKKKCGCPLMCIQILQVLNKKTKNKKEKKRGNLVQKQRCKFKLDKYKKEIILANLSAKMFHLQCWLCTCELQGTKMYYKAPYKYSLFISPRQTLPGIRLFRKVPKNMNTVGYFMVVICLCIHKQRAQRYRFHVN